MARERLPVSDRIVRTVADATGSDPLDLPPLQEVIDADALNSLVEGTSDGRVSFAYAGYEVAIDTDGAVRLEPGGG